MLTFNDNIASWESEHELLEPQFLGQDAIATETQPKESPEWENCVDALLRILADPSSLDEPQPSRPTIGAAIRWLTILKKHFPNVPPTCIIPEPSGGLIVEFHRKLPDGHEIVFELTFYNAETAERTYYLDGQIVQMDPIPFIPNEMNH